MRILIVEDYLGIQFALNTALTWEGHEVEVVDRGEAALYLYNKKSFDLILLDLNTNGISAHAFMDQMTTLLHVKSLPRPYIILLSANQELEFEAHRLGTDLFIKKPFVLEEIVSLCRALNSSSGSSALYSAL